ncbi:MAG: hypothetical protein MUD14_01495 [Hydrococcus sp. Prado102]|jgi:hypothetical protein|nr:hypothetical protein [Hydrococcus sp. Prado102]
MDTQQQQFTELDRKVDRLYGLVEQLCDRITALSLEKPSLGESETISLSSKTQFNSARSNGIFQSLSEHKDILVDGSEGLSRYQNESEQTLSSDIQIRRLTAQLTAAYNRIAALEEQLLDCRINS